MEEQEEKLRCPKCDSDQLTANKRGYSAGKAVAGVVLSGGIGLLAGLHGKDKIVVYCMACGEDWKPSEYAKKKQKYNRSRKIHQQIEQHKLNNKNSEKLINLYEAGLIEDATRFVEKNNLSKLSDENIDDTYNRIKERRQKQQNRKAATILVVAAIFLLLIYLLTK